jgi:GNAT superfamily N-acetyltransferase
VKIKNYLGFRIAKCDVDEALAGQWREGQDDIDVVRVSRPAVDAWPELRRAGFILKPKLIRWYASVGADAGAYRSVLSRKDRWNLRNAERNAERAGLTGEVVSPVGQQLMDEFLALYKERIAEMRRGLDIAGDIRDDVVDNDSFRAIVMRAPDGSLAGAVIGRVPAADGAFRVNISAVTEKWRRASLTRVMYARAADTARDLGLPRISAGTDPNVFGLIAEPGLYSFKARLGFRPTAPQRYLPEEAEHEADLVLRLDQLSDPTLIAGYRTDKGDDDLVLHVFGSGATDLRQYAPGLAHQPVFHLVEVSAWCSPG